MFFPLWALSIGIPVGYGLHSTWDLHVPSQPQCGRRAPPREPLSRWRPCTWQSKHPTDKSKHSTDNSRHPTDKSRHQTPKIYEKITKKSHLGVLLFLLYPHLGWGWIMISCSYFASCGLAHGPSAVAVGRWCRAASSIGIPI